MMMKSVHEVMQNPRDWRAYLKPVGLPGYAAIDLANAMYRQSDTKLEIWTASMPC
jgi:hypothetical protein